MKHQIGKRETNEYAIAEDFRRIFEEKMASLYLLALLLTGDHDKAEQCFVAGIEQSAQADQVFKHWAHKWAQRTIIQSAIRALKPHPDGRNSCLPITDSVWNHSQNCTDLDLFQLLTLDDFERFVFVMSVLEQNSDPESAVLLGCSVEDVREARTRAFRQLADAGAGLRDTDASMTKS